MYYLSGVIATIAAVIYIMTNIYAAILAGILSYFIIQYKWVYLFIRTFPRDLECYLSFKQISSNVSSFCKNGKIVPEIFSDTVKKNPNKVAIISADTNKKMTFQEMEDFSNKIANIFKNYGYSNGDVVGLYMKNEVEYIPIWLGLSKLGIITALINNNLCGEALKHVIETGNCKAIILQVELKEYIDNIKHVLPNSIKYFLLEGTKESNGYIDLNNDLQTASTITPNKPDGLTIQSRMLYIYTSGTTGMPKAAIIMGTKVLGLFEVFSYFTKGTEKDIVYNALPLYHTSGGLVLIAQMVTDGATLIIRKKFSVSHYFNDCKKYDVTIIGYIGEMCRYLLMKPENLADQSHQIRVAVGNGLRNYISAEFKKRFAIKTILEFYGATEGNTGSINSTNTDGAVGFKYVCMWFLNRAWLVHVDQETGEILRDENGLAVKCGPGEPGMMMSVISKASKFHGYIDKRATEKKIAHDVFKKGDSCFITGDLLVEDQLGFLYFVDRVGDSYRWKGENTSATQVENIISQSLNFKEVLVYPVAIPNNDGTAGMAYIHMEQNETLDIEAITKHVNENLPRHSVPLFLRTGGNICVTSTQKHQKGVLKAEGYNIEFLKNGEMVYFYNNKRYTAFTKDLYEQLQDGFIKL